MIKKTKTPDKNVYIRISVKDSNSRFSGIKKLRESGFQSAFLATIMMVCMLCFIIPDFVHAQTAEQRQRLLQMSQESAQKWEIQQEETRRLADSLGLPIREIMPDGTVIVLDYFENGHPVYISTDNIDAANLSNVNNLWPMGSSGLNLSGADRTVGMWEIGVLMPNHVELVGRAILGNPDAEIDSHATHVAGTIGATGINSNARGMANEAEIIGFDTDNYLSEMAEQAADGLAVANHSWGKRTGWRLHNRNTPDEIWRWHGDISISEVTDYRFGFYSNRAKQWDEIAHNAPNFVLVKSAGNFRTNCPENQPVTHEVFDPNIDQWVLSDTVRDCAQGFTSLSSSSVSKNVLSVGAIRKNETMTNFSSWGPTNDGRIKPEVVAVGQSVLSSDFDPDNPGNTSFYDTKNGTSMAAPVVSGTVALLQEHYTNSFGEEPLAATIRALLIHTAEQTSGNNRFKPNYSFGYGLIDAEKAADVITKQAESDLPYIVEGVTNINSTFSRTVFSDGTRPLSSTIAWTDLPGEVLPPGLGQDDLMLMNDLDLRIYYEDGTEYKPWVLDPANPESEATTGDNFRDNVEQVYIENPARGYYTIEVTAKSTNETFSQNFSIITTGMRDPQTLTTRGHLELPVVDDPGYVVAPNSPLNGSFLTNKMSIEFWMSFDAGSDPDAVILSKKATPSETSLGYLVRTVGSGDERRILWAPRANSNWHLKSNTGIRANEWTHVAVVYDDGSSYIYINGELDSELLGTLGDLETNESNLVIGARQTGDAQFYRGKLDDIRIWHGALTLFQVRENMTQPVSADAQGLRAYYQFFIESAGTSSDFSGSGNHLTHVNVNGQQPGSVYPAPPLLHAKPVPGGSNIFIKDMNHFDDTAVAYNLYRSSGLDRELIHTFSSAPSEYFDPLSPNGTTYIYEVTSVDADENEGGFSSPLYFKPDRQVGGKALSFNGLGYVEFPHRASSDISGSELSITFWIKRDDTDSGMQAIITNESTPGGIGYGAYLTGGGEEAQLNFTPRGNSNWHLTSTGGIRANVWTHVALIYDQGVTRIYFNGKLDSENNLSTQTIGSNENSLVIGSNTSLNDLFLHAKLDEVTLWNRALSMSEVQSSIGKLYRGDEDGLAGYWRFDDVIDDIVVGEVNRPFTGFITGNVELADLGAIPAPPSLYAKPVYESEDNESVKIVAEPQTWLQEHPETYRLYRWETGQTPSPLTDLPASGDLTYFDEDAETGTRYFYHITSVNEEGSSAAPSEPISAKLFSDRMAGNALRFETGMAASVQFQYQPTLDITGDALTVEVWVKKDESSQQGSYILGNLDSTNRGYFLQIEDEGESSRVRFRSYSNGNWDVVSETHLEPGVWYHVAGVYDQGNSYIYINGMLDNQTNRSNQSIVSSARGLAVGSNPMGTGNFFKGEIDELRIWNLARSMSQIENYRSEILLGNEEGLVGYWRFDEPADISSRAVYWPGDETYSEELLTDASRSVTGDNSESLNTTPRFSGGESGSSTRTQLFSDPDAARVWSATDNRPMYGILVNGAHLVPSDAMDGDPFRPVLLAPENTADNLDIPVAFEWEAVQGAIHYELEIAPEANFQSAIRVKDIEDTSHDLSLGVLFDMSYFWRVRAITEQFSTSWSEAWQFSTLLPVPEPPVWNPGDGATEVDTMVMFSWGESEYADSYNMQLSLLDDFSETIVDSTGIADTQLLVDGLEHGQTYYWRVAAANNSGVSGWSDVLEFTTVFTSSGETEPDLPETFALQQNYPNPFNPNTKIGYSLPYSGDVRIEVFNIQGQRVATLVNSYQPAGHHSVNFDASALASGIYIYVMQSASFSQTRKMTLIK